MSELAGDSDGKEKQRRSIIRTALVLAGVVLLIYILFIAQGFWGQYAS